VPEHVTEELSFRAPKPGWKTPTKSGEGGPVSWIDASWFSGFTTGVMVNVGVASTITGERRECSAAKLSFCLRVIRTLPVGGGGL
jgi:hypothetical protein